jgi:O-antigen ligase
MILQEFGTTALAFYLVVLNVNTLTRLRILAFALLLVSIYFSIQGVRAYHGGAGTTTYLLEQQMDAGPDSAEEVAVFRRIRGAGFLNDPNDLAQHLLATLPLLGLAWRRGRGMRNLLLLAAPALLLLYAVYLTQSRGAVFGILVLILLAVKDRVGKFGGVAVGLLALLGILVLGFGGGRGFSIQSGVDRLDAWSEGLGMFRSSPLLGVGFRGFLDQYEITAHNSFVLCFSELGLIGYFFWLALIAFTVLEVRRLARHPSADLPAEFVSSAKLLNLSLYTFLATAWFLSRTYALNLFVLVAMGVALVGIARRQDVSVAPPQPLRWSAYTLGFEVLSILLVYGMVRMRMFR